jgi:hypothetical protein
MGAMSLQQKSLKRFSYTLKVALALKRQRNFVTSILLIQQTDSVYGLNSSIDSSGAKMSFRFPTKLQLKGAGSVAMT